MKIVSTYEVFFNSPELAWKLSREAHRLAVAEYGKYHFKVAGPLSNLVDCALEHGTDLQQATYYGQWADIAELYESNSMVVLLRQRQATELAVGGRYDSALRIVLGLIEQDPNLIEELNHRPGLAYLLSFSWSNQARAG